MRWDYVLFDLDGTLNDSMPGIAKGLVATLSRYGRPAPRWQEMAWCIGPPLKQILSRLMPDLAEADIAQAADLYREIYGVEGIFDAQLFPGAPALLAELGQAELPVFLATSKPWIQARRILEHYGLTGFFRGIYGPELDGTRGNKVELIAHLIERENLREREGVMIGDREYDILGGRRNGLFSIGVTYGYGSREELTQAGADALCGSLAEVREFLFRVKA